MTDVTVIQWGDRRDSINFGSSGETVILTGSARLAATIRGQFGFTANTVIVAGEAAPGQGFGVSDTIHLRSLNGVGDNVVAVTGTGVVFAGPGGSAVALEGSGNLLQNAGQMVGGSGVVGINWQDGSVENHGTILGMRQAGVWLLEGGADNRILNTGTITGVGGIMLDNASPTIINTGEILSNTPQVAAIHGAVAIAGFTLRNSGEITGFGEAILGSSFADRVVNTGIITGDVVLGGGDDVYRGRLGSLDGALRGGAGNDTLLAGQGDDGLFGDAGRDSLDGGVGDDTLAGGTGSDVFVIGRGSGDDLVADFQDGFDIIDLRAFHVNAFGAAGLRVTDGAGGILLDLTELGGGTMVLRGMTAGMLDSGDLLIRRPSGQSGHRTDG